MCGIVRLILPDSGPFVCITLQRAKLIYRDRVQIAASLGVSGKSLVLLIILPLEVLDWEGKYPNKWPRWRGSCLEIRGEAISQCEISFRRMQPMYPQWYIIPIWGFGHSFGGIWPLLRGGIRAALHGEM